MFPVWFFNALVCSLPFQFLAFLFSGLMEKQSRVTPVFLKWMVTCGWALGLIHVYGEDQEQEQDFWITMLLVVVFLLNSLLQIFPELLVPKTDFKFVESSFNGCAHTTVVFTNWWVLFNLPRYVLNAMFYPLYFPVVLAVRLLNVPVVFLEKRLKKYF